MSKTVAFITGANKGIGLETARQLGQAGLTVVLGSRDEARGTAAVNALRGQGLDAHLAVVDVTNEFHVAKLPGYFREKHGRLDVLVNNAGVAMWSKDDLAEFRATFEANVFGVVSVTYALLPLLRESPAGRIVNLSSVLGSLATIEKNPDMFGDMINPAYTASKAALNGFTVALANKLRATKIKVNSAHPGWVKTDLGGPQAPMDVTDGAKTAVRLATLPDNGPTGQFFHLNDRLPW
jgi:NAD(P)-dependent dehydrogenase (short-subunit alcohol dehydrogenase family)